MKTKYFSLFMVLGFFICVVNGIPGLTGTDSQRFSDSEKVYYDLQLALKEKNEVRVLDLSNTQLAKVPDSVAQLKNLEVLVLDYNHLTSLPSFLKGLKSLKRISVNHNNGFDLYACAKELNGMKQLKSFSASSCGIANIPYEITYCSNLEDLNFSENYLNEVPYFLSFCRRIKSLNFSGNRIREVGFVFGQFPELHDLDLSGNDSLNYVQLGRSLVIRELSHLKLSHVPDLKDAFEGVKVEHLELESPRFIQFPEGLDWSVMKSLKLTGVQEQFDQTSFFALLKSHSNLISFSTDMHAPELIRSTLPHLEELTSLSLKEANYEDFDFLSGAKQLEKLDVRGNRIAENEMAQLKSALPNCKISSDPVRGDFTYVFQVKPPIENWKNEVIEKQVDAARPDSIVGERMKVNIPANAFLDQDGALVKGKVDVKFVEMSDPVSIALSGIPMRIETDSGLQDFSSAGMFEIRAFQNDVALTLNPNTALTMDIESATPGSAFNFYTLNDSTAQWELNQDGENNKLNQVEASTIALVDTVVRQSDTGFLRSYISYSKVMVFPKRVKGNRFIVDFEVLRMGQRKNSNPYLWQNKLAELLSTAQLVYNGDHPVSDYKKLKSLQKRARRMKRWSSYKEGWIVPVTYYRFDEYNMLTNLTLTPQFDRDDYLLEFEYCGEKHAFHVFPLITGSAKNIQQANKEFYSSYVKLRNEYNADCANAKKRVELQNKLLRRNASLLSRSRNFSMANAQYKKVYDFVTRSINISSFGIHNIDQVMSRRDYEYILPIPKTDEGVEIGYHSALVLNFSMNGTQFFPDGSPIGVAKGQKNGILFLLDDDHVAYCNSIDFRKCKDKDFLPVKLINTKEVSPKKSGLIF